MQSCGHHLPPAGCASLALPRLHILPESLHNQDNTVRTEAMLAWSSVSPIAVDPPNGSNSDATRQTLGLAHNFKRGTLSHSWPQRWLTPARGKAQLLASKQDTGVGGLAHLILQFQHSASD